MATTSSRCWKFCRRRTWWVCLAPQQPSKCNRNSSFFLLFLQPRERGRMRFHKLQNVNIALDFLKIRGVSVSLSNSKPTSQYMCTAVFVRGRQVCVTGVCVQVIISLQSIVLWLSPVWEVSRLLMWPQRTYSVLVCRNLSCSLGSWWGRTVNACSCVFVDLSWSQLSDVVALLSPPTLHILAWQTSTRGLRLGGTIETSVAVTQPENFPSVQWRLQYFLFRQRKFLWETRPLFSSPLFMRPHSLPLSNLFAAAWKIARFRIVIPFAKSCIQSSFSSS